MTDQIVDQYFHRVRREIEPLLPPTAKRIVEVGCASGATLAWVSARYPGAYTIGLEGNPDLLPELRGNCSEAHIVDLNGATPDLGSPDLILFLDVLEHLSDPLGLLKRLTESLAPGGSVIISLPNEPETNIPFEPAKVC